MRRSLELHIEPRHGDGHRLQRTQGMLDGQLEHVVAFLLHFQVAVVGVVVVGEHEVLGGVVGLVGPFLQVGDLSFDLFLDVAEVDVGEFVVHGELVLGLAGGRQERGELALVLLLGLDLVVADHQVDEGEVQAADPPRLVQHPVDVVVDVGVHDCQLAVLVELQRVSRELEQLAISERVLLGREDVLEAVGEVEVELGAEQVEDGAGALDDALQDDARWQLGDAEDLLVCDCDGY